MENFNIKSSDIYKFIMWLYTLDGMISIAFFAIVYHLSFNTLTNRLRFHEFSANRISLAFGFLLIIYLYLNPEFLLSSFTKVSLIIMGGVFILARLLFRRQRDI
jgi:hypothetical protein